MKKKLGKDEICNISGGVGVDSTNANNELQNAALVNKDDDGNGGLKKKTGIPCHVR